MLKNALAAVGLVVVVKTGYEWYRKYKKMEQENEFLRKASEAEG